MSEMQSETLKTVASLGLNPFVLQSGRILFLRRPDLAALQIGGVSVFGLEKALTQEDELERIKEGVPEEFWEAVQQAELRKREAEKARTGADGFRQLCESIRAMVIYLCASQLTETGIKACRISAVDTGEGIVPAAELSDQDLSNLWNYVLSFYIKDKEELANAAEAFRTFLGVLGRLARTRRPGKRAGRSPQPENGNYPSRPRSRVRPRVQHQDGH